jgi:hypothetical protein
MEELAICGRVGDLWKSWRFVEELARGGDGRAGRIRHALQKKCSDYSFQPATNL